MADETASLRLVIRRGLRAALYRACDARAMTVQAFVEEAIRARLAREAMPMPNGTAEGE